MDKLQFDLENGKDLDETLAVKHFVENPERIIFTIVNLSLNEPEEFFSTKEIKEEYKKGLESEVSEYMDKHDR